MATIGRLVAHEEAKSIIAREWNCCLGRIIRQNDIRALAPVQCVRSCVRMLVFNRHKCWFEYICTKLHLYASIFLLARCWRWPMSDLYVQCVCVCPSITICRSEMNRFYLTLSFPFLSIIIRIYIYTLTIVLWSIDWSFQLSLVHSFIRSFFPIIESTGNYDSFIRPTYGISLHWWTHTHTRILF